MSAKPLSILPITSFPMVKAGDDLVDFIIRSHQIENPVQLNDVIVITQKIVSKSEGRLRDLRQIEPGEKALDLAVICEKDPRLVQLILEESSEVLRVRKGVLIVRHRLGFVCANAGIDHSNTVDGDREEHYVLLLPENPDLSAARIQKEFYSRTGIVIGVMIIDSHGRAWRNGTVGTAIGMANVPGIVDLRGQQDLFGYTLRATLVAAADELAAAASLVMGQANEAIPCVIARGFPYPLRDASLKELLLPDELDLFK
jgi:coenzyme F420-0:L-glutamate ligase/coenzyme F420-1:gamma-L-glutamate ligase